MPFSLVQYNDFIDIELIPPKWRDKAFDYDYGGLGFKSHQDHDLPYVTEIGQICSENFVLLLQLNRFVNHYL